MTTLLNFNEIKFKLNKINKLNNDIPLLVRKLRVIMPRIDFLGYNRLIPANLKSYVSKVQEIHNRKLIIITKE